MATVIEVGEGRFIVGDPVEVLPVDSHWCWCGGTGLEYDYDYEACVCQGCDGSGAVVCEDRSCDEHAALLIS
jgi:hypothetical protein